MEPTMALGLGGVLCAAPVGFSIYALLSDEGELLVQQQHVALLADNVLELFF